MPSLVIGQQVSTVINPIETYRFTISQMSGDADSYCDAVIDVEPEHAVQFAQLVECIKQLSDGYHNTCKRMCVAIRDHMSDADLSVVVGDGHLEDIVCEITGYDVTSDGQCLALVDSYKITWFNDHGYEYDVTFVK